MDKKSSYAFLESLSSKTPVDWESHGFLNGTPLKRRDGLIEKLNESIVIALRLQDQEVSSYVIPLVIRLFNSTTVDFDVESVVYRFKNIWKQSAIDELNGFIDIDVEVIVFSNVVEGIKNELESK